MGRRRQLHGLDAQDASPRHCSATTGTCSRPGSITMKQRNNVAKFAALTRKAPPADLDTMSQDEAAGWIHERWGEFMAA